MKIFKKAIRITLKEYLTASSLHGFKYLTCEKLKDRLGWFVVMVLSILMAYLLAKKSISQFTETPTFVVFGDENLQNEHVVALSVSVCPPTPVTDASAREVLKNMEYLHSFEDGYVSFTAPRFSAILTNEMRAYDRSLRIKTEKPWNRTIDSIFFNCSDIFVRCELDQVQWNCMKLFQLTATANGFCCTYSPRKMAKFHGDNTGKILRFIVQLTSEMLESDILSNANHKILIEEDNDFLGMHESMLPLELGIENLIDVTSAEYLVSEDILGMPYEARQCILPNERPNTEWNGRYSHKNCYYNCGTSYLFEQCNCYSLANPFKVADKDICDDTHLDCLMRMQDVLNREDFNNCNCAVTCIFNDTSLDVYPLNLDSLDSATDPFYYNVNKSTMSVVYVRNRSNQQSRTMFSKPLWRYISDLGGICSLFVGLSVPCIIEALYFLLLRLSLNYLKLKRSS